MSSWPKKRANFIHAVRGWGEARVLLIGIQCFSKGVFLFRGQRFILEGGEVSSPPGAKVTSLILVPLPASTFLLCEKEELLQLLENT